MPVSDVELAAALHAALGRPVSLDARHEWPARSSAPMEELEVDGRPLLFKDLTPDPRRARPDFMIDPEREIAVYRDVLGPEGIEAPGFRGAFGAWLFLERVDAVPLDQAPDFTAWQEAARWLARHHARPLPRAPAHLLRYDADWLERWFVRARARLGPQVDELAGPVARAIEHVCSWPLSLVHGEFYPANVLVGGGRVTPVDWETAGIGPALLDVAALTSGSWPDSSRRRVEQAYRLALPPARRPSADALADALRQCRLLLAIQWLGWDPDFEPPPEHAHDWLAEAWRLAAS